MDGAGPVGAADRTPAARQRARLAEGRRALVAERYRDAERTLRRLVQLNPDLAEARELYGLTLYRLRRWEAAISQLQAFARLTGSLDQHALLADCHRALGHWPAVEKLWDELRRASPSAELVAEGRIVAAGALADRGHLRDAIRLLERAPSPPRRPRTHHLRVWYALADLWERVGDHPRARELFRRVAEADPGLADTTERLRSLGS